jgi:hypothetical protein
MRSSEWMHQRISVVTISGFGYQGIWPNTRRRFDNFSDFAHYMGYHRYLLISPQGRLVSSPSEVPPAGFWQGGLYSSFEVFDADDLLVPPHFVLQGLDEINRANRARRIANFWKIRGWAANPADYFRNGPIPGCNHRLRRPKNYKSSGTFAEVREAAALDYDDFSSEYRIRVRGKRSRSSIGDNDWEGVWSHRADDRSWKRHRRHQWKPKG